MFTPRWRNHEKSPAPKKGIRSTQLNIWLGNRRFLGEKNCRKLPQGTPIEIHRRGLWSSLIFGHTRIVYQWYLIFLFDAYRKVQVSTGYHKKNNIQITHAACWFCGLMYTLQYRNLTRQSWKMLRMCHHQSYICSITPILRIRWTQQFEIVRKHLLEWFVSIGEIRMFLVKNRSIFHCFLIQSPHFDPWIVDWTWWNQRRVFFTWLKRKTTVGMQPLQL